ncbi:MAG: ATP-binding protein [Desulfobacteraceae bacterium]|nr:ATP-binding protein [Desulfobacteraceae bacterium]
MSEQIEPIEDLVGDLFVDRNEELRLCREWVEKIPRDSLNSWALAGRRRTGKTAILVKFFNKLFYEQDRVVPVFISFAPYLDRQVAISHHEFAEEYFTGYLASYLAFRFREPLLVNQRGELSPIKDFARSVGDEDVLRLIESYERKRNSKDITAAASLSRWVINVPMTEARVRKMPTAIILDEFQVLTDVYDARQDIRHRLTNAFQQASETHWAPLLVSGSAVTLLVEEALGGMLAGRIGAWHLRPLAQEYTHDLVFRLGERFNIPVTEEFAEAVYRITGGYPYSVVSLLTSTSQAAKKFPSSEALETVMQFELGDVNGKLWQHYTREFRKYSEILNSGQTTRKVMFWATKYPDEQIDAERVAEEIGSSVEDVQTALHKLQQADIVMKVSWTLYEGPGDPMLGRYIKYNYHREIEKLRPSDAVKDWHTEYKRLRGEMNNFIGEVAEVYIEAVIRGFDGSEVDGMAYFNTAGTITLPAFEKIERRGGIVKKGIPVEVDLTGEWIDTPSDESPSAWLIQVKYTHDPIGPKDIRKFLDQADKVIAEKGYTKITRWYFNKKGYTAKAVTCLQQAGVLFSTLEQFNALANLTGFFGLPE